jgi:ATP-dependent DNA helicase RecG
MKLAEFDLKERGPGDLYGTQQSGYSDLVLADISNISLVHMAKTAVEDFSQKYKLQEIPNLLKAVEELQTDQVAKD